MAQIIETTDNRFYRVVSTFSDAAYEAVRVCRMHHGYVPTCLTYKTELVRIAGTRVVGEG